MKINRFNNNAMPLADTRQRVLACIKLGEQVSADTVGFRLRIHPDTARGYLARLAFAGQLTKLRWNGRTYYRKGAAVRQEKPKRSTHVAGTVEIGRGLANWGASL